LSDDIRGRPRGFEACAAAQDRRPAGCSDSNQRSVPADVLRETTLMQSSNASPFLIAFVALTGIAFLAQAAILLAIFLSAKKAFESFHKEFREARDSAAPILAATKGILEKIGPRIEPIATDIGKTASNANAISTDLALIAKKMREEAENVQASTNEIVGRVKHQAERVDGMVTGALNAVDRAGIFVEDALGVPARQAVGALAAVRAIIASLKRSKAVR
jgi:methyl-accepting chemotaxis protein